MALFVTVIFIISSIGLTFTGLPRNGQYICCLRLLTISRILLKAQGQLSLFLHYLILYCEVGFGLYQGKIEEIPIMSSC
jgi:ABC-type uncharacterized transport system permease subunit